MGSSAVVDLFVEDLAHEQFLVALLHRMASEEAVSIDAHVRTARGGHPRVLNELRLYQRVMTMGAAGDDVTMPDVLIVAGDANCKRFAKARQEMRDAITAPVSARLVVACPDPHVERWYLADPQSFKAVVGMAPKVGKKKCKRDYYKQVLIRTVKQAGNPVTLGGIELARDLVGAMNLYRAGRNDRSPESICG
jgi:hypothetical protein